MTIGKRQWVKYTERLGRINEKAVLDFYDWIVKNGGFEVIDRDVLIEHAYGIATKYGEASAALSTEMYDAVAELSKADVLPAVPAETASYEEVAKTVNGVIKNTGNQDVLAQSVGRLVKRAGADTILQNAHRDRKKKQGSHRHSGAEFAWVPNGDTCAYCLALAAQGWKTQTVWAKNSHAEHIHANCDCTYMVRFDHFSNYEGYDPDAYAEMINEDAKKQEIIKPGQKVETVYKGRGQELNKNVVNAVRRENYAKNREKILEQKASAYKKRKELESDKAEEEKA